MNGDLYFITDLFFVFEFPLSSSPVVRLRSVKGQAVVFFVGTKNLHRQLLFSFGKKYDPLDNPHFPCQK